MNYILMNLTSAHNAARRKADRIDGDSLPQLYAPPTPPVSSPASHDNDDGGVPIPPSSPIRATSIQPASVQHRTQPHEHHNLVEARPSCTRSINKRPFPFDTLSPLYVPRMELPDAPASSYGKRVRRNNEPSPSTLHQTKDLLMMLGSSLPAHFTHSQCQEEVCTLETVGHICWDNLAGTRRCCHVVRRPSRFEEEEATVEQVRGVISELPCSIAQAFADAVTTDRRGDPHDRRRPEEMISRWRTAALNRAVAAFCPSRPQRAEPSIIPFGVSVIDLCGD